MQLRHDKTQAVTGLTEVKEVETDSGQQLAEAREQDYRWRARQSLALQSKAKCLEKFAKRTARWSKNLTFLALFLMFSVFIGGMCRAIFMGLNPIPWFGMSFIIGVTPLLLIWVAVVQSAVARRYERQAELYSPPEKEVDREWKS